MLHLHRPRLLAHSTRGPYPTPPCTTRIQPLSRAPQALSADTSRRAAEWLKLDADPVSRASVQELVDGEDEAKLVDMLGKRLEFGQ